MQIQTRFCSATVLSMVVGAMLAAFADRADEPTILDLIKEGSRYVGEQAKDKIVQIRSEKSVGTLTPNIWFVVLSTGRMDATCG
jgi:hypothetical protein